MGLENVMYFVLGLLAAGLLALMLIPAVWRRAVRLTKKRIEAATPMTMAEFRADKDQLRAEFALSTRRLEMNIETLRRRLADQLRDMNRRKTELGTMKTERDSHLQIVRELEEREAELRRRNLELEKETADLAQKLRMRDREYAEKVSQLEAAREAGRQPAPAPVVIEGLALSGDYTADLGEVQKLLDAERRRSEFLEEQNRRLLQQLESSDLRSAEAVAAATDLRTQLARRDDAASAAQDELVAAEARLADAEQRVAAILGGTRTASGAGEDLLLAERLTLEDDLQSLRNKIGYVETSVLADWTFERQEQAQLRERLSDIASDVSRLMHALEGDGMPETDESLFERVQKFAEPEAPTPAGTRLRAEPEQHAVSNRLQALRELQENG